MCKRDSAERAEDVDRVVGLGSSRWALKRCLSERLFKHKMPFLCWSFNFVAHGRGFRLQRQRRAGDALQGGQGGSQDGALCLHGTLG